MGEGGWRDQSSLTEFERGPYKLTVYEGGGSLECYRTSGGSCKFYRDPPPPAIYNDQSLT